nr:hypothetical protein [Candidatus Sigynarchaeota archaeon]
IDAKGLVDIDVLVPGSYTVRVPGWKRVTVNAEYYELALAFIMAIKPRHRVSYRDFCWILALDPTDKKFCHEWNVAVLVLEDRGEIARVPRGRPRWERL